MTTPDQSQTMADQGTVAFHQGGSDLLTITVDPSLRYQRMDGFGASLTDSSASVLSSLDPATRDATMRDLFVRDGLSVLRQPIGSSDFVDGPALHLRRRAGRRDGLRPVPLLDRPRPSPDPAAAASGASP